jgi:hypothetical protein
LCAGNVQAHPNRTKCLWWETLLAGPSTKVVAMLIFVSANPAMDLLIKHDFGLTEKLTQAFSSQWNDPVVVAMPCDYEVRIWVHRSMPAGVKDAMAGNGSTAGTVEGLDTERE